MFCLALEKACLEIFGKFKFELSSMKFAISEESDFLRAEQIK